MCDYHDQSPIKLANTSAVINPKGADLREAYFFVKELKARNMMLSDTPTRVLNTIGEEPQTIK